MGQNVDEIQGDCGYVVSALNRHAPQDSID